MRELPIARGQASHRHAWIWEPLEDRAGFLLRPMFGAKAVYLDGKLMFCCCAKAEPWRGLLICTERSQQASLIAEFPMLSPHPILPKWLYLPEADDGFEKIAKEIVRLAGRHDPRIGIVPPVKKKRSGSAKGKALSSDRE